ncbi:MAG: helix-turn-helix domain-containing protein [Clostridia bacterium]|nr:helix-turn-helix domain-containing protein [Clostridia bacterium]
MKISTEKKYLPIFKALASDVRLDIIKMLSRQPLNIKDIASELNLSSAIITMHVKKLEEAGIITCETININGGRQKICTLDMSSIEIAFPSGSSYSCDYHNFSLPIGHYTKFDVRPTCGLASQEKIIGQFDEVRSFLEPERVDAQILWFSEGFVEYTIPNYLLKGEKAVAISISMEIGSEYPGVKDDWPSEITFSINGVELGSWISPGDFGNKRGKLNPPWWGGNLNQYGSLKVLNVNADGTYIDGKKISDICITDLKLSDNPDAKKIQLRFEVKDTAKYKGGLTLYGSRFGNYDQDIIISMFYERE